MASTERLALLPSTTNSSAVDLHTRAERIVRSPYVCTSLVLKIQFHTYQCHSLLDLVQSDARLSKMPFVNGLGRHLGINPNGSNIGGHSQVRNSIVQARAQLRSRGGIYIPLQRVGTQFVRGGNEFRSAPTPVHDVITRHNIVGNARYEQAPGAPVSSHYIIMCKIWCVVSFRLETWINSHGGRKRRQPLGQEGGRGSGSESSESSVGYARGRQTSH